MELRVTGPTSSVTRKRAYNACHSNVRPGLVIRVLELAITLEKLITWVHNAGGLPEQVFKPFFVWYTSEAQP